MTSSHAKTEPPQIAVWYFVGATFLFTGPTLFFPDAEPWVPIVLFVAGFAAIVAGGIQFGRELTQRRTARDAAPPPEPDPRRTE